MEKTLLSILAGLGGMFGWGSADFFASQFSGKIGHIRTFLYSQITGLLLVGVFFLLTRSSFAADPFLLLLTFLSGIAYGLAYLFFYRGFAIGNVSVISAVINLQNVFIIGIAFLFFGQRITGIQIPALFLLLVGVLLVSTNFNDLKKGKVSLLIGVKETFIAALLFGIFFWPLNQYVVQRTAWLSTSLFSKFVAVSTVFMIALILKEQVTLEKNQRSIKAFLPVAAVGLLDTIGLLSVSSGLSVGNAIIIAPISSALTVVTVGLAVIFLKEKIDKVQALGIAATVMGIVMMGLGG